MLDSKLTKKLLDTVYAQPRSMDELSKCIGKNWRTTDRYVQKIIEETGELGLKTFREGTRGALKIVYFKNIAKLSSNQFQDVLLHQITDGKQKEDFSPFDIYQYIDDPKRKAYLIGCSQSDQKFFKDFEAAKNQILVFSGNMSWINFKCGEQSGQKVLEKISPSTSIKIITRIDFAGQQNIEDGLKINLRNKKESIEIRHCYQPLRGYIIDDKLARFWETKVPMKYKKGELKEEVTLFYEIYDPEWIDWLKKLFWNLFSSGIPAQKRIDDIKSIKELKVQKI